MASTRGRGPEPPFGSEVAFERGLPTAIESEKLVLAAMITGAVEPAEMFSLVQPHHFAIQAHRVIAKVVQELDKDGMRADRVMVAQVLLAENQLDAAGGFDKLLSLEVLPHSSKYEQHCYEIVAKHGMQQIITSLNAMLQRSLDWNESPEAILKLIAEQAEKLSIDCTFGQEDATRLADLPRLEGKTLLDWAMPNDPAPMVANPFPGMVDMLDGFREGELIVIGARPGVGKTAMAIRFIEHCEDYGVGTLLFSLEMSAKQLAQRFISGIASVNSRRMRMGNSGSNPLTWFEIEKVKEAVARVEGWPSCYVADNPAMTVAAMRAKARPLVRKGKVKLMLVDYLGLVRASRNYDKRVEAVSEITRDLKLLAKELGIPIVLLSQLSRDSDKGGIARAPVLTDLRESGSIEQDADIVLFPHPETHDPDDPIVPYKLIVGKQRNGPSGSYLIEFVRKIARFQEKTN